MEQKWDICMLYRGPIFHRTYLPLPVILWILFVCSWSHLRPTRHQERHAEYNRRAGRFCKVRDECTAFVLHCKGIGLVDCFCTADAKYVNKCTVNVVLLCCFNRALDNCTSFVLLPLGIYFSASTSCYLHCYGFIGVLLLYCRWYVIDDWTCFFTAVSGIWWVNWFSTVLLV